ncbi:hypothetical protein NUC90_002020 [Salmonella enterica subsp. enterica serovar Montevideo]|uniref:Antitermination protein n=2 Tax=Salmonella enterica TaxID=28901 RepID=A0A605AKT9_SALMO|nr:hypothetical protein [Salmonella enterica]EBP3752988.1 hypothetical protein [Salmonella enterica subsp. enterica]EBV1877502.1 hypothetical protein [Salmonella enterica subsp. enterica serovar Adelaide]ECA3118470.1 hypothetical protein [Salmonella enterica subsp. enterica serovar Braenderup]EDD0346953.1 hypothetical protein [Salmonella enterica subsp. enterica serovar Enteritidis]EDH0275607.1 hypothetical protein [Salmonella enterica subsp. enterica serovar Dublin]EEA0831209.1 hypothetical 
MTVITYGKSTFAGNAKTRRHERRRKLAIERDTICNIIDSIFGCDVPDGSQEVKAKRIDRVTKAILLAGTRQKEVEVTAVKRNRIYYRDANPLGNKIHAVQKQRGKSIPAYYD